MEDKKTLEEQILNGEIRGCLACKKAFLTKTGEHLPDIKYQRLKIYDFSRECVHYTNRKLGVVPTD